MSLLAISEQAINGLIVSAFYALTALGLAIIFGVLRIVNFAHGELYMLGGYAYYLAVGALGVPPVFGVVAAALALMVLGGLIERLLIRPVHQGKVDRPEEYAIMITFALSILLLNLANSLFGPWPQRPQPLFRGRVEIGELIISGDRVAAAGTAVLLIAIVILALRFTWAGKAVRAVSQNRQAAEIYGISVARVVRTARPCRGCMSDRPAGRTRRRCSDPAVRGRRSLGGGRRGRQHRPGPARGER